MLRKMHPDDMDGVHVPVDVAQTKYGTLSRLCDIFHFDISTDSSNIITKTILIIRNNTSVKSIFMKCLYFRTSKYPLNIDDE